MKKYSKLIILLLLLLIVITVIYLTFFNKTEKTSYLTEMVKIGSIHKTVNATGEVSAVQLVNVGAQVSGQILKLHVQLGQNVKKGDLIAEIDSTTQVNELETQKARSETYKAQLTSAEIALSIAQTKYNRETALLTKKATSKENVENAKDTLASAKSKVAELKSSLKQTQISLNTAEANLGYTRIVAPLDGTIVSMPVEEGQTVNANQSTPTIVQVADLSQMQIKMLISEGDVTKVKPDMTVSYTILSEPDIVYNTTLKSVDPGLTSLTDGKYTGSTDTNTAVYYYGNLVVPNKEGKLHIGMTTQNTILIAEAKDVLIVPTIVVKDKAGKKVVNLLEANDEIVEKEVQIGLYDSMNTQIISGLKEKERVISSQMTDAEISGSAGNVRIRSRR